MTPEALRDGVIDIILADVMGRDPLHVRLQASQPFPSHPLKDSPLHLARTALADASICADKVLALCAAMPTAAMRAERDLWRARCFAMFWHLPDDLKVGDLAADTERASAFLATTSIVPDAAP